MLSICLVLSGCKPRTINSISDAQIRLTMMAKTMADSQKFFFLNSFNEVEKEKITRAMKKYEHFSGSVDYDDVFLNYTVRTTTTLEQGMIRTQIARYERGTLAFERYIVGNTIVNDSSISYYPNGSIFNRTVNPADSTQRFREDYFPNGRMRTKSTADSLFTWHENGQRSGIYHFKRGQVVNRTLWHENGVRAEESQWKSDKINGRYQEWDTLGHQTRNELYALGKLIKKY